MECTCSRIYLEHIHLASIPCPASPNPRLARSSCLTKSNNFMQLKPFFIKNANFKCKMNSSHVKHQHSPTHSVKDPAPASTCRHLLSPSVCTHASWLGFWAQVLNLMSPNKSTLFQHVPDTPSHHPGRPSPSCPGEMAVAVQRA